MTWYNQDPADKNLEALAQSLSLENLTGGVVQSAAPTTTTLPTGRVTLARVNNVLYLYFNDAGTLRRLAFS